MIGGNFKNGTIENWTLSFKESPDAEWVVIEQKETEAIRDEWVRREEILNRVIKEYGQRGND